MTHAVRPGVTGADPMLDQTVQVETPEQVVFSYSIAGVGSRAAAALIDTMICLAAGVVLVNVLNPLWARTPDGTPESAAGMWVMAIVMLLMFAALWGYYVFFEGLYDGQTPGKRYMNLRVVQDGGYSISFAASAVRNVLRVIDMQPFGAYCVGLVSIVVSRSGKRLGDILAGTMVVQERAVVLLADSGVKADASSGRPLVAHLAEEEYALLERFVARRNSLDPERRRAFVDQLSKRFEHQLGSEEGTPAARIVRLYEHERAARAAGSASRSDTGARREQHALVAGGTARWRAFAERLRQAQQRGLARMPEEEVSEFVAQYRELSTDLARLQTALRGRQVDALFYLGRLVAGGHNLLYRRRRSAAGSVARYLTIAVPREIRASWGVIGLSALTLFGPAVVAGMTLYRHPDRAREIMSPPMIDRVETAAVRARQGVGYVDIPEADRPVAASGIIRNNVSVTYLAFALGLSAGVGTIFILLLNGVVLGGFFGLYASTGEGAQLLAFVAPHGVLELSAIVIGGAAGLHLATALLLPGSLTRNEALIARGRRSITLIAGATMMLLVAGTIEGLISPRVWPLEWKLWVSGATALLLAWYLTRGRDGQPDVEAEQFAYSDARALISR